LNAAPALPQARRLAGEVDHLVVNESEAVALCGRPTDSPRAERRAVEELREAGFPAVTLTRGERGVLHLDREGLLEAAAPKVAVVDTTAAGDAFVGGLAAAWARGGSTSSALALAVAAGSLAVTRPGAQPSLPSLDEARALAASIAVAAAAAP
jgi:ribokinase